MEGRHGTRWAGGVHPQEADLRCPAHQSLVASIRGSRRAGCREAPDSSLESQGPHGTRLTKSQQLLMHRSLNDEASFRNK